METTYEDANVQVQQTQLRWVTASCKQESDWTQRHRIMSETNLTRYIGSCPSISCSGAREKKAVFPANPMENSFPVRGRALTVEESATAVLPYEYPPSDILRIDDENIEMRRLFDDCDDSELKTSIVIYIPTVICYRQAQPPTKRIFRVRDS